MKYYIILAVVLMLLFAGCINLGNTGNTGVKGKTSGVLTGENTTPEGPGTNTPEQPACEPKYTPPTSIDAGTFGKSTEISVKAECAAGKSIGAFIDGNQVDTKQVSGNDSQIIKFVLRPASEGTKQVEIKASGETIYSKSWQVAPLGEIDTTSGKSDSVSLKDRIAQAVTVDYPITVKTVGVYMRRPSSDYLRDTSVVTEITADEAGKPGSVLMTNSQDISKIPMSDKWIWFPADVTLQPGKYWVVVKLTMDQDNIVSDLVTVYYSTPGSDSTPNDNALKMSRQWSDDARKYLDTSWGQLSYDKTYDVQLSGISH